MLGFRREKPADEDARDHRNDDPSGQRNAAESQHLKVVSNVFLKLIKCIIVPIIFGTLVVGIAGHSGDLRAVGRLALKSIIYFEIVTTLALGIGLVAVNLAKPGVGVVLPGSAAPGKEIATQKLSLKEMIEHAVPKSFFESAAANDVLPVVVFAVIFAVALTQVTASRRKRCSTSLKASLK